MDRFDNIREYAEFNHEAAKYGGPLNYFRENGIKNYKAGKAEEKAKDPMKFGIGAVISIALWETGKFVFKKVQDRKQQRHKIETEKLESKFLSSLSESDELNGLNDNEGRLVETPEDI